MRIKKVINNNVVSVVGEKGMEFILTGKGIGFQKKAGDPVDRDKIEKTFRMEDKKESYKLEELFKDIPIEHIKITSDCIEYAKTHLDKELSSNIYITLMDHINIAIERCRQDMPVKNHLLWDIQDFYPREFEVAQYMLKMVKDQLGIQLKEDEAGFITMHLVNAELGESQPDTINIAQFIQDAFAIIEKRYSIELSQNTDSYDRFVSHLKYLGKKIMDNKKDSLVDEDEEFHLMIKNKYPDSYNCVKEIVQYIEKEYDFYLAEDEIMYLIIYVQRIIMNF